MTVTQYEFNLDNLKSLNGKDEYTQRWILLTMKFICDKYSVTDFVGNSYAYLDKKDSSEEQNVDRLLNLLKLGELDESSKLNKAKEEIKEFLDKANKNDNGSGYESYVCKDVRNTVMSNTGLFDEFNVAFPQWNESKFNDPATTVS